MTPGNDSHPALAAARESGIVPLMSSADPEALWRAAETIVEEGLGMMEVVFRTPGTAHALARVIERASSSHRRSPSMGSASPERFGSLSAAVQAESPDVRILAMSLRDSRTVGFNHWGGVVSAEGAPPPRRWRLAPPTVRWLHDDAG